jgi:hypothetical protein
MPAQEVYRALWAEVQKSKGLRNSADRCDMEMLGGFVRLSFIRDQGTRKEDVLPPQNGTPVLLSAGLRVMCSLLRSACGCSGKLFVLVGRDQSSYVLKDVGGRKRLVRRLRRSIGAHVIYERSSSPIYRRDFRGMQVSFTVELLKLWFLSHGSKVQGGENGSQG